MRGPVACGLTIAWATAAFGSPASELADEHVERARTARASGALTTAVIELQAAYSFDPRPALLEALGQLYRDLGDCTAAKLYVERFLSTGPTPALATAATESIASCGVAAPTARSSSAGLPSGLMQPGDAPAYPIATMPLDNASPFTLNVDGLMTPGFAAVAPAAFMPSPMSPVSPAIPPGRDDARPGERRAWYVDPIGVGLIAGGLVAGLAGAVSYAQSRSSLDEADHARDLARYEALNERAHDKRATAVLATATGVGLLIGGVIRLAIVRARSSDAPALAVTPTADGGVITWARRF